MIWSWKFGALGFVGEWNEAFANVVFSNAQKYFCWLDSKKRRYEKFGNLHKKESLNFVEVSPAGRADTEKPWNLLVFVPAREWVVLEFVIFDRSVSRRWIFLSTGVLCWRIRNVRLVTCVETICSLLRNFLHYSITAYRAISIEEFQQNSDICDVTPRTPNFLLCFKWFRFFAADWALRCRRKNFGHSTEDCLLVLQKRGIITTYWIHSIMILTHSFFIDRIQHPFLGPC